jgi:hypothetical protein
MRITTTQPLFAWGALDDSPRLATLRELLAAAPRRKGTLGKMSAHGGSFDAKALREKITA